MDKDNKTNKINIEKYKPYLIAYLIILIISFFLGSQLGLVTHEWIYNITCIDTGEVEWFNESTEIVCGGENPLHVIPERYKDFNYLNNYSFNLT